MKKIAILLIFLAAFAFAEYRFIMINLHPYAGEDGIVYIEFMGQIDAYYAENL